MEYDNILIEIKNVNKLHLILVLISITNYYIKLVRVTR